jgi:hypothetical protein
VDVFYILDRLVLCAIGVVAAAVSGYAFAHALRQRPDAFTAVGRLTKNAWLGINAATTALYLLLIPLFGLLANPRSRAWCCLPGPAQQQTLFWLAGLSRRWSTGRRPPAVVGVQPGTSAGDRLVRPRNPAPDRLSRASTWSRPRRRGAQALDPAEAAQVGVAEIDPALADTAAFCAAYGSPMDGSANCVVVAGRRRWVGTRPAWCWPRPARMSAVSCGGGWARARRRSPRWTTRWP